MARLWPTGGHRGGGDAVRSVVTDPRTSGAYASIGTWERHFESCFCLRQDVGYQFRAGEVTLLATGVTGHQSYRAAGDHYTEQ